MFAPVRKVALQFVVGPEVLEPAKIKSIQFHVLQLSDPQGSAASVEICYPAVSSPIQQQLTPSSGKEHVTVRGVGCGSFRTVIPMLSN